MAQRQYGSQGVIRRLDAMAAAWAVRAVKEEPPTTRRS